MTSGLSKMRWRRSTAVENEGLCRHERSAGCTGAAAAVLRGRGTHLVVGRARPGGGTRISDQLQQCVLCCAEGIKSEVGGEVVASDAGHLHSCAVERTNPQPSYRRGI